MKERRYKQKNNQTGFTLIELLIYISLVSVTMLVMMNFMTDVTKNAAKTKITKDVQQNARLILSRIMQDIRTADDIISISQSQIDLEQGGQTISYTLSGTEVLYNDGSGPVSLTSSRVRVDSLLFFELDPQINVSLTVRERNTSSSLFQNDAITLSSAAVPRQQLY